MKTVEMTVETRHPSQTSASSSRRHNRENTTCNVSDGAVFLHQLIYSHLLYHRAAAKDKCRLQHVIPSTEKVIGSNLPPYKTCRPPGPLGHLQDSMKWGVGMDLACLSQTVCDTALWQEAVVL